MEEAKQSNHNGGQTSYGERSSVRDNLDKELARIAIATANKHKSPNADKKDRSGYEVNTENALCIGVNPDVFFPVRGANAIAAKTICMGCKQKEDCLDKNLTVEFGIHGGMSVEQKKALRSKKRKSGSEYLKERDKIWKDQKDSILKKHS